MRCGAAEGGGEIRIVHIIAIINMEQCKNHSAAFSFNQGEIVLKLKGNSLAVVAILVAICMPSASNCELQSDSGGKLSLFPQPRFLTGDCPSVR